MSTIHRPLTPATPAHTPHGSLGSIRSRTPGQLSLHEYRRQQTNASPLSDYGGHKLLKKKIGVSNLHNAPEDIPTAPPTPQDASFGDFSEATPNDTARKHEFNRLEDEEDEDAIIEANILKYTVGRARKEHLPARESASRLSLLPRSHRRTSSANSSISIVLHPRSVLNSISTHSQGDVLGDNLVSSHNPTTTNVSSHQLRHTDTTCISQLNSRAASSSPNSTAHQVPNNVSPAIARVPSADKMGMMDFKPKQTSTAVVPPRPPKVKYFKAIKRLPRPTQPPLDPSLHSASWSDAERSSESLPTVTSHNSPFDLSNFQFPAVPVHVQSPLRKSQSYENASHGISSELSMPDANLSFSDLLYLYGADRDRTSKNGSSSTSKGSQSQSEKSSQALPADFLVATKHVLPKMTSFTNDPFNSRPMSSGKFDLIPDHLILPLNRESSYTENWDSQSIIGIDENVPPGRALGIIDYADVGTQSSQHDSYTPINTILDQYGRLSLDSIASRTRSAIRRPPGSPPPPVPALPVLKLNLPIETSTLDHTTDYGMTRDLLRDESSVPIELGRSHPYATEQIRTPAQEPSSVYDTSASPMPAFAGDPETVSIALSTLSDEWQTIANTSTNELSGNFSSMADYAFSPFPTHYMPPLHINQQRRAITYDEIPEVPSPQSTLPELDAFRQSLDIAAHTFADAAQSDYSADLQSIPATPDHDHSSMMRYSLHDGADTIDMFPDRSPQLEGGAWTKVAAVDARVPLILESHSPNDAIQHETIAENGLVDVNILSSEPNDAIDISSERSEPTVKHRKTLSSMLLGRPSKRSSRNFSNQRNLIELQMPKRTSSLRATELRSGGYQRNTQLADGNIRNGFTVADGSKNIDSHEIRATRDSENQVDDNSHHRGLLAKSAASRPRRLTKAHMRPTSSAASTEPLIYDQERRKTIMHRLMPSLDSHAIGGHSQLHLAEEGAYTNISHGAKEYLPTAIALSNADHREQIKRSRFWFLVFLPFPFFLILYSFGLLDRLAGPRGMLKHYKRWARYVVVAEVILILIALTVWGVARRGK